MLRKTGAFSGVAIETSEGSITYHEFDRKTDRFAVGLMERGIGPGSAVILHMKRSIGMVVAMFGILKSGAAFVPIVWDFPLKRFNEVKRSSEAVLVVTDGVYRELMDGADEAAVLSPIMAKEQDPAVILYTSGSTGVPKGVVQNQASLGFLFLQYPYGLSEAGIGGIEFEAVMARLNHGYVVAYHFEYPIALLNGKRLLLLSEEEQNSIADTCDFLEKTKACSVAILPSQLNMFLEEERFVRSLRNVGCLCFFGEPLSDALKRRLLDLTEYKGEIISVYGQTEVFGIGWQDFRGDGRMRFSPGTYICTIDGDGNILKKGDKGELAVRTQSAFTVYLLGDDEKSKEAYDQKNIWIDGKRYVRTGDLGAVTENNEIRLFGRNDRMVKYHGQRVELSEIEKVMNDCAGIRNSCALVVKSSTGNDVLVAYYEGEHDEDADITLVRTHMAERLPAFMIPLYFIRLAALPHNTNGKVDYTALRNMPLSCETEPLTGNGKASDDRSLSEKELLIVRVSARLLKVDEKKLSAASNLMALGMDSLKAVVLLNELSKEGYFITIEDFISSADIHALSERIKKRTRAAGVKKDVSGLVRCTDMQSTYTKEILQIVRGIVCKRNIDEGELHRKIKQLSAVHPVFRSSFIEDSGRFFTKVLKTRPIRYDYADIREFGDEGDDLSELQREMIRKERVALFLHPDPADLIYVKAFWTHPDKTVILIRFDHRAVDGMTERLLFREFATGEAAAYVDHYIEYLDHTGDEKVIREAVDFWKDYLSGTEAACIPKNRLRFGIPRYKRYSCTIAGSDLKRLKELCTERRISLSAYILCQYGRAVMDVLGRDDIIIPVAVSGRSVPVPNTDGIAGCLVNEVPVRLKKNYTERDFMESYLKADRYGFLQKDIIFSECFGMSEVPQIAPFIVSEIFPDDTDEAGYELFERESFELFNRGEFLWEDHKGVHLILHPDVDLWEEGYMDRVLEKTEALITENLK